MLNATEDGILLRRQRIIIWISLRMREVELAQRGHQGIVKTKSLIRSLESTNKLKTNLRLARNLRHVLIDQVMNLCGHQRCQKTLAKGFWRFLWTDGNYWFVNHYEYSRWFSFDLIKSCSLESV